MEITIQCPACNEVFTTTQYLQSVYLSVPDTDHPEFKILDTSIKASIEHTC